MKLIKKKTETLNVYKESKIQIWHYERNMAKKIIYLLLNFIYFVRFLIKICGSWQLKFSNFFSSIDKINDFKEN